MVPKSVNQDVLGLETTSSICYCCQMASKQIASGPATSTRSKDDSKNGNSNGRTESEKLQDVIEQAQETALRQTVREEVLVPTEDAQSNSGTHGSSERKEISDVDKSSDEEQFLTPAKELNKNDHGGRNEQSPKDSKRKNGRNKKK